MSLRNLILSATLAASAASCASTVCEHRVASMDCVLKEYNRDIHYKSKVLIDRMPRELYCEIEIDYKFSGKKTIFADNGCNDTVDALTNERAATWYERKNNVTPDKVTISRSQFGDQYDALFKELKQKVLEGRKE